MTAAEQGHTAVVVCLLKFAELQLCASAPWLSPSVQRGSPSHLLSARNSFGQAALHFAVQNNHLPTATALVDAMARYGVKHPNKTVERYLAAAALQPTPAMAMMLCQAWRTQVNTVLTTLAQSANPCGRPPFKPDNWRVLLAIGWCTNLVVRTLSGDAYPVSGWFGLGLAPRGLNASRWLAGDGSVVSPPPAAASPITEPLLSTYTHLQPAFRAAGNVGDTSKQTHTNQHAKLGRCRLAFKMLLSQQHRGPFCHEEEFDLLYPVQTGGASAPPTSAAPDVRPGPPATASGRGAAAQAATRDLSRWPLEAQLKLVLAAATAAADAPAVVVRFRPMVDVTALLDHPHFSLSARVRLVDDMGRRWDDVTDPGREAISARRWDDVTCAYGERKLAEAFGVQLPTFAKTTGRKFIVRFARREVGSRQRAVRHLSAARISATGQATVVPDWSWVQSEWSWVQSKWRQACPSSDEALEPVPPGCRRDNSHSFKEAAADPTANHVQARGSSGRGGCVDGPHFTVRVQMLSGWSNVFQRRVQSGAYGHRIEVLGMLPLMKVDGGSIQPPLEELVFVPQAPIASRDQQLAHLLGMPAVVTVGYRELDVEHIRVRVIPTPPALQKRKRKLRTMGWKSTKRMGDTGATKPLVRAAVAKGTSGAGADAGASTEADADSGSGGWILVDNMEKDDRDGLSAPAVLPPFVLQLVSTATAPTDPQLPPLPATLGYARAKILALILAKQRSTGGATDIGGGGGGDADDGSSGVGGGADAGVAEGCATKSCTALRLLLWLEVDGSDGAVARPLPQGMDDQPLAAVGVVSRARLVAQLHQPSPPKPKHGRCVIS
jgi:hypothetical protein